LIAEELLLLGKSGIEISPLGRENSCPKRVQLFRRFLIEIRKKSPGERGYSLFALGTWLKVRSGIGRNFC
jgi:hypothetical protein